MNRLNTILVGAAVALLGASGCDWGKFDDLGDKAPATRIEEGNGKPLLGFVKPDDSEGGVLLLAGTGSRGSITQARIGPDGKIATNTTGADDFDDVNKLNLEGHLVRSFAPVWEGADSGFQNVGPLAFIGSTAGKIQMVDTDSWREKTLVADMPSVPEFGVALALVRFSTSQLAQDLVVGAQGAVYLVNGGHEPFFQALSCSVEGGESSYTYSTVAAGQSGTVAPIAVVAAPQANFVTVMGNLENADTATGDCSAVTYTTIEKPDNAMGFGSALWVDDLDGDLDLDVVVGAPDQAGGGAVYLYDQVKGFAKGAGMMLTPPPDADAASFGAALAVGKFDGVKRMLAVGAPDSRGGKGSVFLYDVADFADGAATPVNVIALDTGGDRLGLGLTVVPLKQGSVTREVLVAGAKSSALVFWANTTPEHKDFRTAP